MLVYRYRFLRSQDRELNKDRYPKLNYPEVYLLEGGYKAFYHSHSVSFVFFLIVLASPTST